jgi:hypothetical protein
MQHILQFIQEYANEQFRGLSESDREKANSPARSDAELDTHLGLLREIERDGTRMGTRLAETMTTAHFFDYFSAPISRMFLDQYQILAGTWQAYTTPDTAPDFRPVQRFRMSRPGGLKPRGEKQGAEAGEVHEDMIEYGVGEYAEQFDFSWQAFQNDDLGYFTQFPVEMAKAALWWKDEWVSALYDNPVTQATLAGLGPVFAGTGALTLANLTIAVGAMQSRVDPQGRPLSFRNLHLVIPPILQIQASDILADLIQYGGPGGNTMATFLPQSNVHVDPYITYTNPNVPWYLFAGPDSSVNTITVVSMTGWGGPVVYMDQPTIRIMSGSAPDAFLMGDSRTGDIVFHVNDIVGGWDDPALVGVTNPLGIYYSDGTTA